MSPPRDPFDPDHPPHWIDEEGNFGGWLTEAEIAVFHERRGGVPPCDRSRRTARQQGRRRRRDRVLEVSATAFGAARKGKGAAQQSRSRLSEPRLRESCVRTARATTMS